MPCIIGMSQWHPSKTALVRKQMGMKRNAHSAKLPKLLATTGRKNLGQEIAWLQCWAGQMNPQGYTLFHPASLYLFDSAMRDFKANTDANWTLPQIEEAITCRPHMPTTSPHAMAH